MKKKYQSLLLLFLLSSAMPLSSLADEESGDGDPPQDPEVVLDPVTVRANPDPPEFPPEVYIPRDFPAPTNGGAESNDQPEKPAPERPDEGCNKTANPVVIKTGTKVRTDIDWTAGYRTPLHVTRSYNAAAHSSVGTRIFGPGWFSNFDAQLAYFIPVGTICTSACVPTGSGGGKERVERITTDGSRYTFIRDGSSWLPTAPGSNATLSFQDNTWVLQYGNRTREVYNSNGLIKSIRNEYGIGADYFYSGTKLSSVVHTNGERLAFEWTGERVTKITIPPENHSISYKYDANGMLSEVQGPGDLSILSYGYQPAQPHRLVSVSYDGTLHARNDYFPDGKVSYSERAGGLERESFTYGTEAGGKSFTEVSNSVGGKSKYTYSPLGRLLSVERNSTVGCPATQSKYEYDAAGLLVASEDFNGVRTCYQFHPDRREELARIEGLPSGTACTMAGGTLSIPGDDPKTSRRLHPDWSLEIGRAAPSVLDTWIYHGMPDPTAGGAVANCVVNDPLFPANTGLPQPSKPIAVLCKAVRQATLNTTGSQGFGVTVHPSALTRVVNFTYDQFGRVRTRVDERGRTTSYDYYHTKTFNGNSGGYPGQLYSITNAKGQSTTFRYDQAGRLISTTDPNGASAIQSYSPRGELLTETLGLDASVRYEYHHRGLLKRKLFADGFYYDYEYDGARRLTRVVSSDGNSTSFELIKDLGAQGYSHVETTKGANGEVTKVESRQLDALGRVRRAVVAE